MLAGTGGESTVVADQGGYSLSRCRLEDVGIDPTHASVFRVRGESMTPTLANGSLILVDYLRDAPRQNCLYVFRSGDALLVKRAQWRRAWWWYSDNPKWEPFPLEADMRVWGEVRWHFRLFRRQRKLSCVNIRAAPSHVILNGAQRSEESEVVA